MQADSPSHLLREVVLTAWKEVLGKYRTPLLNARSEFFECERDVHVSEIQDVIYELRELSSCIWYISEIGICGYDAQ